jgi:hypothetical protein
MGQTILTLDAYLALLVVLINFVFIILILVRTPRTLFYSIFLFIFVANMFWNFGDFMAFFTGNRFWFYLSLVGSGMLPALMFHWVNTIVRPEKKNTLWIVPAYFFSGFLAFSSPLTILHPKVQWFVDSDIWNLLFLVLLGPFLLAGMIMLFYALRRAKSEDEKSRLRYFNCHTDRGSQTHDLSNIQNSTSLVHRVPGIFFILAQYSNAVELTIFVRMKQN